MSLVSATTMLQRTTLSPDDWPATLDAVAAPQPRRRRRRSPDQRPAARDNLWLWAVDMSLMGVVLVAPFLLGGRHPLGRLVLIALTTTAISAWLGGAAVHRLARPSMPRAMLVFLGGALLIVLQLAPLSAAWLSRLSPAVLELLPMWTQPNALLGAWATVSLTPAATLDALSMWLVYAALFWVAAQRVATADDVARLTRWLGVSAVAMAVFGLVQYLSANGSFFWCYEHPHSDTSRFVKGAFTNRNHFAHWMALGLGPLLAWLIASVRGDVRSTNPSFASARLRPYLPALIGGAAALVVAAALLSLSRGGALALMAAASVVLAMAWRGGQLRGSIVAALLGSRALILAVLMAVNSVGRVASRLDDLSGAQAEDLDRLGARRAIWQANLEGIARFPWLGAGIGSHREVYPLFLEGFGDYEFTHAENGYLQIGLESGAAGLGLLLAAFALIGRWCWLACRQGTQAACVVAPLLAVLAASAVHSLVDFVWYVPAAAAVTAIVSGCLWRLSCPAAAESADAALAREVRIASATTLRWPYALTAAVAATCGLLLARTQVGPLKAERAWEQYLLLSEPELALEDADDLDPAVRAERFREHEQAELQQALQAVALLEACAEADPHNARAHLRLSAALVRRFELTQRQAANSMGVFELRAAATAARFANREALAAWLDRAIGPTWHDLERARWHALAGLRQSPLSGEGYLLLAQVGFLTPEQPLASATLLAQAARVRPHDGSVLFQRGREELLAGRPQEAMPLWRRSYAAGSTHQRRIVDLLAGRLPARVLIEQFEPNLATLRVLRHRCDQLQRKDDLAAIAPRFAQAAVIETPALDGSEAARVWVEAHRLFRSTDQLASAFEASRRAVERDPHGLGPRMALAEDLLALRRFDEAAAAYRWCRSRRPDDPRLARGLEAALRGGRG